MKCGIYKIRNIINNKVYIGSTSRKFESRWSIHKKDLFNNKHHSILLQRAFNKYGESNFIFEIIEEVLNPTKQLLEQREQYWIDYYDSCNPEKGYNICPKAYSCLGVKRSDETKQKLSESRKGKCCGENHHLYGKHHSEETRKKLSESHMGEKNHNYGKHFSEERRRKISESNKGKIPSIETRQKMSKSHEGIFKGEKHPSYGKHPSMETIKKLSLSHRGKKASEETKQKMSENHYDNRGENSPNSKLTWKQIEEIRKKYIPYKYTQQMLSEEYKVSKDCIRSIVEYKTWKVEKMLTKENFSDII